jgi:hypothetical protein
VRLQLRAGILGARLMVINVDSHGSNLYNLELADLVTANKILLVIPPSRTSVTVGSMGTQQCDRPAHLDGPIADFRAAFRRVFEQQCFANQNLRGGVLQSQGSIPIAEIADMLAKAWQETLDGSKMEKLNADAGYYVDGDGYLQWDPTRLLPPQPASAQRRSPLQLLHASHRRSPAMAEA